MATYGSIRYSGVADAGVAGGTDAYTNTTDLPTSNVDTGTMAYVSSTNKLYMWNGSAWFNIAIVNQAPTAITGNAGSYTLASDGTPTTITLVSTDPEGFPLTWSATTSGDTQVATVTNADNVFTVTPSTNQADEGTLSVTFSVTDGSNTETSVSSFTLTFIDWTATTQQAKIQSSDIQGDDRFGYSVGINGDTVIVGARLEDESGTSAGAAYIFTRSGSTWTEQQKLTASDGAGTDNLGWSSAIDGDTAVTSARNAGGAGAAYVFTRSGSTWTEQQKLTASDPEVNDHFGQSVAISGDTVICSANDEDTGGGSAGAAYIFTRSGSTWTQQAKIQAADAEEGDHFGWSVGIDGDTVVVSAYRESTGGSQTGAVYIFTRSGSTWTQQAKIQASDIETSGDEFGFSVAISGDTVVVGARLDETGGSNAGSAYILTRSGSTWTQQAKIQASDAEENDFFGWSVGIDGDTVVVSAAYEDTGALNAGSAYIFTRDGSTWTQQAKIQAADAAASDEFGYSVGIDGTTVIVGARYEDTGGNNVGAAYIFTAG